MKTAILPLKTHNVPNMAANYWSSTQKQYWFFSQNKLADLRDELNNQNASIIQQYPYPDRRLMFIFMKDRLLQLGRRPSFRQQCVATALTYLQRYFLFTPMQNVNIYLLVATAFYLASKTEEAPHHIRVVAAEARQAWPEFIPADVSRLGEMEFCLISEMQSQLIVWHPYRSLMALKETQELALTNEELVLAWSIVNDTYMTDLPLTCPPHLIAVTAMFLAVNFVPNKSTLNFQTSSQDITALRDQRTFAGLGGRPGLSNAFGIGNGSSVGGHKGDNEKGDTAALDVESVRAKTIAAAMNSEKMQRIIKFLVESDIDIERMIEATQEIISLYEVWESYSEKSVKEAISKCLKSRTLDN